MDPFIRTAQKKDMPEVLALIHELAAFEKEPDAVDITVDELISAGFGNHPMFTCFVSELDHKIVGIALFYYRFSTWKGRTIHLEDLIVKKEMRGKGVGSALYTAVLNYAASKSVRRVEWVVLDWNTPAINFYKKSGATILKNWHLVQMDSEGLIAYQK